MDRMSGSGQALMRFDVAGVVVGGAAALVLVGSDFVPEFNLAAAGAVFVAAIASSIAGFAFSAIAAAMLMHIVNDHVEAVQIMLVASIAQQAYSLFFIWRSIRVVPLAQAVAGGLLALPAGLYLLLHVPSAAYKVTLGLFLVVYCLCASVLPNMIVLPYTAGGRFIVGCLGGITGPSAAFPGAFPTLWVSLTAQPKDLQRGFFQPYILIMQVAALFAVAATPAVNGLPMHDLGYVLPALCGAHFGLSIFRRLSNAQFATAVRTLLLLSGIGLIATSLR